MAKFEPPEGAQFVLFEGWDMFHGINRALKSRGLRLRYKVGRSGVRLGRTPPGTQEKEKSGEPVLKEYLDGTVSFEDFCNWFYLTAWDDDREWVCEIKLLLAEYTSGHWSRLEVEEKVKDLLLRH